MIRAGYCPRGNQRRLAPKDEGNEIMNAVRHLILTVMAVAGFCASPKVWAQASSTPQSHGAPPVTVVGPNAASVGDVPPSIRSMITSFNAARERFLAAQNLLLIKLKNATTAPERQQIRAELQANRQAFLEALRSFREQLKTELAALKGKISHEEFLRIIDAAHNAAIEGGLNHHRGH